MIDVIWLEQRLAALDEDTLRVAQHIMEAILAAKQSGQPPDQEPLYAEIEQLDEEQEQSLLEVFAEMAAKQEGGPWTAELIKRMWQSDEQ